jgi:hypothetical protein
VREVEALEQREASARVRERAHAEFGKTVQHALVAVFRLGERPGREHRDCDAAAGALLDFPRPGLREFRVDVLGREEDRVFHADGFCRAVVGRRATAREQGERGGGKEDFFHF